MNKLTIATVAAAGLSAAVLGLAAPAAAAPTSGGNADSTISQLEADGHRVIVNRLSDTPLDEATVVAVQPGPALRGTATNPGYDDDTTRQNVITGMVYYIDVR